MNNLLDRSILRCVNFVCGMWTISKSIASTLHRKSKQTQSSIRLSSHKKHYRTPVTVFSSDLQDVLESVDKDARHSDGFGYKCVPYRGFESINDNESHLLDGDLPLEFFVVPSSMLNYDCFYGYYLGYLVQYEIREFGSYATHLRQQALHIYADLSGNLVTHRDSKRYEFGGPSRAKPVSVEDYTQYKTLLSFGKERGSTFAYCVNSSDAYRPRVDSEKLAAIMEKYLGPGQSRYLISPFKIEATSGV